MTSSLLFKGCKHMQCKILPVSDVAWYKGCWEEKVSRFISYRASHPAFFNINYHSPAYLILWVLFSFTFFCVYMGTRSRIFSGLCLHQVIGWRSVTGAQFKATCRFRNATILHTLSHKLIHLLSRGETIHIRKTQHMVCHPRFGTFLNHGSSCLMMFQKI